MVASHLARREGLPKLTPWVSAIRPGQTRRARPVAFRLWFCASYSGLAALKAGVSVALIGAFGLSVSIERRAALLFL